MPAKTVEDGTILELLIRQPEQGIRALQSLYGGLIFHIVSRILSQHPEDMEEVAADVLVTTWKQAGNLRQQGRALAPWLVVTARNRAIDRWRTLVRKDALPLNEDAALMTDPILSDAEETIGTLVKQLGEPDREIFLRRYYRLETAKEIGEALGMPPNTVNVRLARGREKLKKQYLYNMGKEHQQYAE